jgi:prepilin-type N-terminal cleavage/methylation domain-containing protein
MIMRTQGFTLIELLFVITIVSILASILMPALTMVRGMAHSAKCASNLRQIGVAMELYTQNWHGRLPPYYWTGGGTPAHRAALGYQWPHGVRDFLPDGEGGKNKSGIWGCPTSNVTEQEVTTVATSLGAPPVLVWMSASYGHNMGVHREPIVGKWPTSVLRPFSTWGTYDTQWFVKLEYVLKPSVTVAMAERASKTAFGFYGAGAYAMPPGWINPVVNDQFVVAPNAAWPGANSEAMRFNHRGRGNLLYYDRHVGLKRWNEPYDPSSPVTTLNEWAGTTGD